MVNSKSELKQNILANYLGAGTVALAPILALPWYLAELGPKQFGLIGFIAMLQAVLGLLDAGMSQALVREVAIRHDLMPAGRESTASLLYSFERVYWLFGVGVACLVLLFTEVIVGHWLNLEGVSVVTGQQAVWAAAAIFAAQFPGSLYRSVLVGVQAQVSLNASLLAGALVRHGGGVLLVIVWPTLSVYLIWHATTALLETLLRGRLAWRALQVVRNHFQWKGEEILSGWRLFAGLSGATWLGALTVQMDKIILSGMISIEQFGYYSIAAAVATGVLQFIYPLVQAVLPRAIGLRDDPAALHRMNFRLAGWIALIVGTGAIGFVILGKSVLGLWLRAASAVDVVYPLLSVLLVGTALNAFYNVGYVNWVVHKRVGRVLLVNAAALALSVAIIPPLIGAKGPMGAAFGWLAINLIGFVLSLEWLWKRQGERNS